MPPATEPTKTAHPSKLFPYRPEIDGLRALAILLVITFHAFPSLLPGAFIGVDVFFVISGYLITRMIAENLEANTWSLVGFYFGRARRLFPSLIIVTTAALVGGWWILFPDEYERLGRHAVSSLLFVSNFDLMREPSYFSPDAASNPFLHLWRLGVEEQFYLWWPLAFAVSWRRSLNPKLLCWTLLGCSLLYCIYLTGLNPTSLFYSPLSRSWELLVGAALALHATCARSKLTANIAASCGLILITVGTLLLSKSTAFPGAWGLLPTLGATLIIWAGPQTRINTSILSLPSVKALGLISYPLYLWHWVLFSYAAILCGSEPTLRVRVLLVGISILLSWLTFTLVERPFRYGRFKARAPGILLALISVCALAGHVISRTHGLPERRTKKEREFLHFFENSSPRFQYLYREDIFRKWQTECAFFDFGPDLAGLPVQNRRNTKPIPMIAEHCYKRNEQRGDAVLLWGDSHVMALSPGLRKHLPRDWQLLQISTVECPPSIDQLAPSTTSHCDHSNYFAVKTIKELKPEVVVLAQNEDHSPKTLQEIAAFLKTLGVSRVVIVGPVPHWDQWLPHILARSRLYMPRRMNAHLVSKHSELNDSLKRTFATDSGQKYADLMQLLCNEEGCLTYLGNDVKNTITSYDYGHLTLFASDFVAQRLLVDLITSPD